MVYQHLSRGSSWRRHLESASNTPASKASDRSRPSETRVAKRLFSLDWQGNDEKRHQDR